MNDLDIKLAFAKLAEITAQSIKDNDLELLLDYSKHLRQEVDEEINHRNVVAKRRSPQTVKELQERTGMGLYTCKNALEGANWDINKALSTLSRN
jgi:hypothetical protein